MADQRVYMLDTNICIYIQRRKPSQVLQRFKAMRYGDAVISLITWGELLYGAAKSQNPQNVREALREFASLVPVMPMAPDTGAVYGELRATLEKQGQPIGNNDLWIAAHALSAGLILVANNMREFARIPGLRTENWA